MATKRKRIPQHLEHSIEDVATEIVRVARLNGEMNEALTDPRGVNKYLIMSLSAKIGESVAHIEKALDRIERREGPPNGTLTGEVMKKWLEMIQELLGRETSHDDLSVIVANKIAEFD